MMLSPTPQNCSICGNILEGRYLKDYWGNSFHPHHKREYPECFYCGRLVTKNSSAGGKKYSDGKIICGICRKTSVETDSTAVKLVEKVRNILTIFNIQVSPKVSKVHLLDRRDLDRTIRGQINRCEESGYTRLEKKLLNGELISFSMKIFILKGLPESYFLSTVAHELMHVWQHLYAVPENHSALKEGSCNFAVYLLLTELSKNVTYSSEANYIINSFFRNPDKNYGKGFRKVYELSKKLGVPGWLDFLKTHRRLPLFI